MARKKAEPKKGEPKDKPISDTVRRGMAALGIEPDPQYEGPTAAGGAGKPVASKVQQQEDLVTAFDDSVALDDPYRSLPEAMDGVIQLRTPEQVASDKAYLAALEDPTSVLTERVRAPGFDPKKALAERGDISDAGVRLSRRAISEHHEADPERMERLKAGLLEGADNAQERYDESTVVSTDPPPDIEGDQPDAG